jgi:excinuclease ABC subunit A
VRRHTLRTPSGEKGNSISLPELMACTVDEALGKVGRLRTAASKLRTLHDLGLGYLTLGEATPALSGGEAQRLKLASEMGRGQEDSVFVFDEPTIGLHPKDVRVLLEVFRSLLDHGATVIVIEHDLDVIRSADYIVDMGPGGGAEGGRIVVSGRPAEVRACPESLTGQNMRVSNEPCTDN